MRGILFYDEAGAKRNEWFIDRMITVARENGSELKLAVITDTDSAMAHLDPLPDYAIVRTILPSLNEKLQKLNIPVFNNAKTSKIANNKWLTHLYGKALYVPVMETKLLTQENCTDESVSYPRVVKTVDGHGGSEVFLVKNAEECKEILALHPYKQFISQELSSEPGVDMRVYVLGEEILAPVMRTSKSDFRSNFSLGGNAALTETDEQIESYVWRITHDLGSDLIGIDFIRHGGKWVLNEIEDVVGTRMLYSLTDIDAAKIYVEYIISKVKQGI